MGESIWSKLNIKQQKALLYYINNPGIPKNEVAKYVDVTPATISNWKLDELVALAMEDIRRSALDLISSQTHSALRVLVNQLESDDQIVANRAAKILLEYGLGKPEQITRVGNIIGEAFEINGDTLRKILQDESNNA